MASRKQIVKLTHLFSYTKANPASPSLPKSTQIPLSSASLESHKLPTWLCDNKNSESATKRDEDFIIPSLANWVENHNLVDGNNDSNHLLFDADISDVDKASEILRKHHPSMDSVVQALNQCSFNATSTLISQLLQRFNNDWVPAYSVFNWAKYQTGYVHSPELYNSMVDVLGKQKQFILMWELVEEMKNLQGYISLDTMTKVFRRLAKAGKYENAIDAFRRIEKYGLSKDVEVLNALMDSLVKGGSVEHAYCVCMEFKDSITMDCRSLNILIHGYCKIRKLEEARKIMEEMEKYGFHPDVVAYTCIIESYCKMRDFKKVNATLDEMQEKGCKPNTITYTIVMHALGKSNRVNEALEVYEKMKRNDCVPDSSFYSSLIFTLSRSGRVKDAWDIFEDMKNQGVSRDLLTYNTMISSACTHSQEEEALQLLQRMEEDSCQPDLKTYAPLLKMCCRKKRMNVLKILLNHMMKKNVSIEASTYTILVGGLCKSGKLDHACSFFEEAILKGMIPKDTTYRMLVEALEQNNMSESKETIQKLMFQANDMKQV